MSNDIDIVIIVGRTDVFWAGTDTDTHDTEDNTNKDSKDHDPTMKHLNPRFFFSNSGSEKFTKDWIFFSSFLVNKKNVENSHKKQKCFNQNRCGIVV